MSNPARPPKVPTTEQLALAVAPDSYVPADYRRVVEGWKSVEGKQRVLAPLDMDLAPSFYIPKEHCVEPAVLHKLGGALALAKGGVTTVRLRSDVAKAAANVMYAALPAEGPFSKTAVGEVMASKVLADGGTECCLGRLAHAYPKRVGRSPVAPVGRTEAVLAVARCGVRMQGLPAHAVRPYPLTPAPGEDTVKVNPKSDNGFPVLGKWDTPGAALMCMRLAVSVRQELGRAPSVAEWMAEAERSRPWLVALRGKAKADYYSVDKVCRGFLRFYNAFPRQMMLIMQQATQVLELNALHIQNSDSTSGIGITLVRRGAEDLVAALDGQLRREGHAYVHVGDDSWVIVKRGTEVAMFALDCSNFDLTQRAEVTEEVHRAIWEQLRLVDPIAADVWLSYARARLVVVAGALVRKFYHAGPSGMPLQSKVNDVLMEVMVSRALSRVASLEESDVARAVEEAGLSMGFSVKLEQFWRGRADTVVEALEQRPFLFIGYYFHVRGGTVRACADVPRTLAQLPFPALKWSKTRHELRVTEAMRLGSIAMALGMPTQDLEPAFQAYRAHVLGLLDSVIAVSGDVRDERLRWAVQSSPWGPETEASLRGLRRAVARDAGELWLTREVELPSESVLVGTDWADEVEAEEAAEAAALGATTRRPATLAVRPAVLRGAVAATHPASARNDGRPPPTVVWGPPKAPRVREEVAPSRRERRRDGLAARQFQEELQEWSEGSTDSEWGLV